MEVGEKTHAQKRQTWRSQLEVGNSAGKIEGGGEDSLRLLVSRSCFIEMSYPSYPIAISMALKLPERSRAALMNSTRIF